MRLQQEASPEAVRQALREVLARREFQDLEDDPLARAITWLLERLRFGGMPEGAGGVAQVLLASAVLVALLFAAVWVAGRLRARRRILALSAGALDAAALARRVAELRARARAAREQGDLALALRLSFFALVVGLGERGDLEYHDAWTNRELFERGRPAPEVARELGPLVRELDRRSFGGAAVRPEDVAHMERLCARWLDGPAAGSAA